MTRTVILVAALALTGIGAAIVYQAATRDRDYRTSLARGDTALGNEQTFGAIEAYSGAIALRPDSMLAHLRRGETYQRRGDLEAAARDFRTAAALDLSATRPLDELGDVLYQQRRFQRAAEIYERCLRLDDRSARVGYKLALARYHDGNLDAALAALAGTVRLNDRMADAHYLEGICLRETGRPREAQRALEKAVALAPGLIAAREELADLYSSLGRRVDEIAQLEIVAGLDRDRVERQVAVGLAQARAGHPELAVLTLGSTLERSPDQPIIYAALGRIWFDIAQAHSDRPDALAKALEALARVAPTNVATSDILTVYGRALLLSGQVDAAERTLQQATERYPLDATAFLRYATVAERQNHLDAARRALIAYGTLVADDEEFLPRATRIATLSLRVNDVQAAIAWLERAVAVSPNDATLLVALADAQIRAGNRPGAEATISRALRKDPQNAALLAQSRRLH